MFSEKRSIQFYLVIIGKICEIEPVSNSKLEKNLEKGELFKDRFFWKVVVSQPRIIT